MGLPDWDGETPLFDGLGSERTVTNSSGAVTASLTPSAFGQMVSSSGSSSSPYQFGATSGYRSEGDAGLTLVGCRSYDAQVGRFITRDTYLDQKPYAYCDGDPVNATDPEGLSEEGGDVHIKGDNWSPITTSGKVNIDGNNFGPITITPLPGGGSGGGSGGPIVGVSGGGVLTTIQQIGVDLGVGIIGGAIGGAGGNKIYNGPGAFDPPTPSSGPPSGSPPSSGPGNPFPSPAPLPVFGVPGLAPVQILFPS